MRFSPALRFLLTIVVLFTSLAAAPFSPPLAEKQNTEQILADLGGFPCADWSGFTCVTIEMPLDHFNLADTRTIPVTFAVLPAFGERKGMFVTATGGPGTSGVQLADSYSSGFDLAIFESFDIVFFDQRGVGLSGGLNCPVAATAYYQRDSRGVTPKQEKALRASARTFADECVNELSNPELLPYLGTRQAVEDLELFRQIIGDEKFWLYGESYGTQFAQTYAAAHGQNLAGLILDATVDMTFTGFEYYAQQAQAFNDTLVATLTACNEDPACAEQMNGDAIAVYDELVARLSRQPLTFRYPLANGRNQSRKFTLSDLEYIAISQLYGESDRMMFTRALAAYAANEDLIPLARLLYIARGLEAQTLEIIPDPSWSDALFYSVECQDYGYPGSRPEERAKLYLEAVDSVETSIPRLASLIYADLPCAYWPDPTSNLTRPGYLLAEGVPTLVLAATADPATPVSHGVNVYQNLANGFLITTQGGPHVTFGYGNACPDQIVTDFLVGDILPAQRETVCEGVVADTYVPVAPRSTKFFSGPAEALAAMETELYYLPELFYWDGFTPTTVGCTYGGTFGFESNASGTRYNFDLDGCELTANFRMTGSGLYHTEQDRFVLDIKTTGRWKCDVRYARRGDQINISGKCDGKPVRADQLIQKIEQHQMPTFQQPKDD